MRRGIFKPPGAAWQSKSGDPLRRRPVGRGSKFVGGNAAAIRCVETKPLTCTPQSWPPSFWGPVMAFALTRGALQIRAAFRGRGCPTAPPGRPAEDGAAKRAGRRDKRQLDRILEQPAEPLRRRHSPPANVDPGLAQPAPDIGPHSMPVIPPPGTPGGTPDVKPKQGPPDTASG